MKSSSTRAVSTGILYRHVTDILRMYMKDYNAGKLSLTNVLHLTTENDWPALEKFLGVY